MVGVSIPLKDYYQINEQVSVASLLEDDATDIFYLVEQNRTILNQYLYWVQHVVDIDSATKYIANRVNSTASNNCWYKISFQNKTCGVFGVKSIEPETSIAEIGYWLSKDLHGRGVVRQVIERLKPELKRVGANVIEFRCLKENKASISVAERSGAKLVRVEPDAMTINNIKQALLFFQVKL